MERYENLANAIVEKAVDDYIRLAQKLQYLKDNKYQIMSKIVRDGERLKRPIHYTSTELQAEYNRKVRNVKIELMKIEQFFFSEWYQVLTKVDGKELLRRVQDDIKEKYGIVCDFL